ncbi:hypothetical protein KP806_15945 [Paenibacillus sp. N4]|uniref:DUF6143 family protein n=1 Tax=Paenibacillus vietnamensis TaxID=2590547 RepID=UPI001CD11101|nr:DUF6143 family protein [Paenibacillus vietnamensis]MCA0756548.1 hypothetical protein [Paenibacillus vietnamensis]
MYPQGPVNVVNLTTPFVKSMQGKYFLGETDQLNPTDSNRTWGALVNPPGSGVNLYVDIYVISNLSDDKLLSQICFCSSLPANGMQSHEVSSANLALHPKTVPHGQIQFGSYLDTDAFEAVPVSTRVVPAYSSVSSEKSGHWIIGPGKAVLFTLTSALNHPAPAVISFGWWEEPQGVY